MKQHVIVISGGIAGDYLGGPFMDGAFLSGKEAAERLLKRLQ